MNKASCKQFALERFLMKRKYGEAKFHFNGKAYFTLTDLIEENKAEDLSLSLVSKRIDRGVSIREALYKPRCEGELTHPKRSGYYYDGKYYSNYKDMIIDNMHTSLSYSAVYTRLRNGWSLTEALQSPRLEVFKNLNCYRK